MRKKEGNKKAEKAFKNSDYEAARSFLAEIMDKDTEENRNASITHLIVNDAMGEKLGELLQENPRGLLLVRDEFAGFLAKMENKNYEKDRAFYLATFNGDGEFIYDRIPSY